jgi:hypothetical protein
MRSRTLLATGLLALSISLAPTVLMAVTAADLRDCSVQTVINPAFSTWLTARDGKPGAASSGRESPTPEAKGQVR